MSASGKPTGEHGAEDLKKGGEPPPYFSGGSR